MREQQMNETVYKQLSIEDYTSAAFYCKNTKLFFISLLFVMIRMILCPEIFPYLIVIV